MIIFRVPPQINPLTPSPVEINHSLYHNPCRSFASPIPTKAIQENKEARRQTPSLAVSNAPTPASHHSSSPHPQPKKSPAGESRTKEQHRYLLWRRLPQQAFWSLLTLLPLTQGIIISRCRAIVKRGEALARGGSVDAILFAPQQDSWLPLQAAFTCQVLRCRFCLSFYCSFRNVKERLKKKKEN